MHKNIFVISGAVLLLLLAACSGPPQYKDYYVSIQGNNISGNGSQAKPWRTIQYAIDHANYSGSSIVRVNLAKGIYTGNLVITDEIVIVGAGASETVTTQGDPNTPVQNVSVIARQIGTTPPGAVDDSSITVAGAGSVKLENLSVFGGGLTVADSDFNMENVIVYGVTGFYGIKITDSSFSVLNSKIITQPNFYSDYGLYLVSSSGYVTNSYVGNRFDHAINIDPFDATSGEPIDVYDLPVPINVYIVGSTIVGSPIYYADGIRIQGAANVVIKDTKISRGAGSEPASKGTAHNPPYAAIDAAGWMPNNDQQMRRVDISGAQLAGFNVGIGVTVETFQLKVQTSMVDGLTYGVQTKYVGYTDTVEPSIDFGGGPLGSIGQNTFGTQSSYAYHHDTGPYLVHACHNNWKVSTSQIDPTRIYDKLDKPSLGRVFWNCVPSPNQPDNEPQSTPIEFDVIAILDQNANCREGNSTLFEIADTLLAGSRYFPISRGGDGLWLQFEGPTYGELCWVFVDGLTLLLNDAEIGIDEIPEAVLPLAQYPKPPTLTSTLTLAPEDTETPEPNPAFPQCSDGKDNDGDGQVDMADRECRNASDNDEANS